MTSFKRADLPATLADAFYIEEWVRERHIWIDALCIIQDDLSDWAKEGSNIAGIYRGARLTIAAISTCSL